MSTPMTQEEVIAEIRQRVHEIEEHGFGKIFVSACINCTNLEEAKVLLAEIDRLREENKKLWSGIHMVPRYDEDGDCTFCAAYHTEAHHEGCPWDRAQEEVS